MSASLNTNYYVLDACSLIAFLRREQGAQVVDKVAPILFIR